MTKERHIVKRSITIISRSDDERLVTSIVADPENIDSYGNMIDREAIRQAALLFMERFANTGVGHQTDSYGHPVVFNGRILINESWFCRAETVIDDEGTTVPSGSWILTFRIVDDEIWDEVVKGVLTGFSFEALVSRKPIAQKSLAN